MIIPFPPRCVESPRAISSFRLVSGATLSTSAGYRFIPRGCSARVLGQLRVIGCGTDVACGYQPGTRAEHHRGAPISPVEMPTSRLIPIPAIVSLLPQRGGRSCRGSAMFVGSSDRKVIRFRPFTHSSKGGVRLLTGSRLPLRKAVPCMTVLEGNPVASEPRMTTELVERTEEIIDLWNSARRDNVIDLQEQRDITRRLQALGRQSADVDEGLAIVVAMVRRGPDSERAKRLMGERRQRLRLVIKNDPQEVA